MKTSLTLVLAAGIGFGCFGSAAISATAMPLAHVLKKIPAFSMKTCSNSVSLSCVLIDHVIPRDRDTLWPGLSPARRR
jgi:hypothetical protein